MKISLTTTSIDLKQNMQEVVLDCDLVFSLMSSIEPELEWLDEHIDSAKRVKLHNCGTSDIILAYVEARLDGKVNERFSFSTHASRAVELETIYQSLPRGTELEIYTYSSFRNSSPQPKKLIIPHEN